MDEAVALLGQHLPVMDVAEILATEFGLGKEGQPVVDETAASQLESRTREYLEKTVPLLARPDGSGQHTFLLVPASKAGKALGDATCAVVPDLKHVKVPGQADLMFCRDQGGLTAQDLQRTFKLCRRAYESAANNPTSSAHARFDISDWLPLDP
jgi:hypothetical protein